MEDIDHHGRLRESVTELIALAQEVSSLSQGCETERRLFNDFSVLVDKFIPILNCLRENVEIMEDPQAQEAVESLGKGFFKVKGLVSNPGSKISAKQVESSVHDLGRSLGFVLFTSVDECVDLKDKVGVLYRDLMGFRIDPIESVASSSRFSEIVSEYDAEEEKISSVGVDNIVSKLKHGNDEEVKLAALGLSEMIEENRVDSEWIENEGVIPALFDKLSSSKSEYRLIMIHLLRTLALNKPENKEKMVEASFLTTLVRSLMREDEERREAVGLLLELSEISAARRRIGRIRGCIIMLVALLNGVDEDPIASRDAGKLLDCLSGNTQNALHMAEAGYFKPIVQYLKEGSDMSKILMATALSRMELTDLSRASLGQDGAIKPLAKMFATGKLEAKLSSLNALQNLSTLPENVQRLLQAGILSPLLQLLFSVTSALMTLREPASAILARIAESETGLVNHHGVAQQILSLLNLSSPVIQVHLLEALNSIAANPKATKARRKMKENGAVQLLLPFLMENNVKIRGNALNLLHTLSKDLSQELSEQIRETHIVKLIGIVLTSKYERERSASLGILSYFPTSDKRVTEIFKRENLLPVIILLTSSNSIPGTKSETKLLEESVAGVMIRFTNPSDKRLQLYSAENGAIPLLVKLLSSESLLARTRAATSLSQLSQNTSSMRRSRATRWLCVPASADAHCEVHEGYCSVKTTFCLVKSGAVPTLFKSLEGQERDSDEAVLGALATLLQDNIWESGSDYIARTSRFQSIVKVLESGASTNKARERALWILERVFRIEEHRVKYGESAQVVLIDLAQQGDSRLKPMIAKVLAQLELLQTQSSYF